MSPLRKTRNPKIFPVASRAINVFVDPEYPITRSDSGAVWLTVPNSTPDPSLTSRHAPEPGFVTTSPPGKKSLTLSTANAPASASACLRPFASLKQTTASTKSPNRTQRMSKRRFDTNIPHTLRAAHLNCQVRTRYRLLAARASATPLATSINRDFSSVVKS